MSASSTQGKIIATGIIVDDADFGLSVQTPEYEYIKIGDELRDYVGCEVEIKLKSKPAG